MPRDAEVYRPYLDNGQQGFVYVLTNKRLPNLVKIGATRKHPLQRAKELGAGTGVPEQFNLLYFRDFASAFVAEALIHDHFDECRINEDREFFEVDSQLVIDYIDGLAQTNAYKDLCSEGVTGGSYESSAARCYSLPETPLAELFATFPDDGSPRSLTSEELAQCQTLLRA